MFPSVIIMIAFWTLTATAQNLPNYQSGLDGRVGRSLLQTSLRNYIVAGDQVNGVRVLSTLSQDTSNVQDVAQVLFAVQTNGFSAYTIAEIFSQVASASLESAAFLGQVMLAAEGELSDEMSEVIVAAISLGSAQTEGFTQIIAQAVGEAGCVGLQATIKKAYSFAQSQGRTRDLEQTLANSGSAYECLLCLDFRPTVDVSCMERQLWGECEVEWMIFGYHCAKTCGFCLDATEASALDELKAATTPRSQISVFVLQDEPAVAPEPDAIANLPSTPLLQETSVIAEEEEEQAVGLPLSTNLEQAILSASPKIAAQEINDLLSDNLVQAVLEALISSANAPNGINTTAATIAEVIVQEIFPDDFFNVLYASLMPQAGGINMALVFAQAVVTAGKRVGGADPAAIILLKLISTEDQLVIEPVLQQIALLASQSCNGIEALATALSANAASSVVVDLPEVQFCISGAIEASVAVPESLPAFSPTTTTTTQALQTAAPVIPTTPIPAGSDIDRNRPLQLIGYIDVQEAARLILNEATRYVFTSDSSIFVGDLKYVAERGQMAELAQALGVAMQTAIEINDVGASYALALGLPELVAFSGGEVAVSVAAALSLVHEKYGCDGIDDYIRSIAVKTKELSDGGAADSLWGAALNQYPQTTECLGDNVRSCTGFALRDCCQVGDFPEGCNFCGFQFAKQCRFRRHESSIPASNYYVYADKSFDGILCKCPAQ